MLYALKMTQELTFQVFVISLDWASNKGIHYNAKKYNFKKCMEFNLAFGPCTPSKPGSAHAVPFFRMITGHLE